MAKIDIFSGFLGAGKTTLIKKLLAEVYKGERLVLIENEFGEIGVDGGFLADAGINVTEMNSGCICCSLVGVRENGGFKGIDGTGDVDDLLFIRTDERSENRQICRLISGKRTQAGQCIKSKYTVK